MGFKIQDSKLKDYQPETGMTEVSVPHGVLSIGSLAFSGHSELTRIDIPRTVQYIGYKAFYHCPDLIRITVSAQNHDFSDIDGIVYDKKQKTLLFFPNGRTSISLPDSVTEIKDSNAFADCPHLTEISVSANHQKYTVLNGVLYEHNQRQLTKLVRCPVNQKTLVIPDSVTEICCHAFEHCTELTEITFSENITRIGDYAFQHCENLKHICLPKKLKFIGDHAFACCTSLQKIILPSGVRTVLPFAFGSCSHLEEVVIPESVIHVGYIFSDCKNLKQVTCHHIDFYAQACPEYRFDAVMNAVVYLIVRKKFDEPVSPALKYDIIFKMFLNNQDNAEIYNYISKNFQKIIKELISANQTELLRNYIHAFRNLFLSQDIDEFIRYAIDEQKYEIQVMLTNDKYQHMDFQEKDWTL